jgi:hypothetical protein
MAAFPTPLRQPPINRVGPGTPVAGANCVFRYLGIDSRPLQSSLPQYHHTPAAFQALDFDHSPLRWVLFDQARMSLPERNFSPAFRGWISSEAKTLRATFASGRTKGGLVTTVPVGRVGQRLRRSAISAARRSRVYS